MRPQPAFAHGQRIGARAKHVWICSACGGWFTIRPDKSGRCANAGAGLWAHRALHFASQAEAARYQELRLLQRSGKISDLKCQPKFPLAVNGVALGNYRADFGYGENGLCKFEEVKGGAMTEISDWKRRHAEAQYGIEINIVRR